MRILHSVDRSWIPFLHQLSYQKPLVDLLQNLYSINYQPKEEDIFKVFTLPVNKIKLVILGDEPYSMPNTSTGLAFDIQENVKQPLKLKRLYQIVSNDFNNISGPEPNIKQWSEQGVLLLNSTLTVETNNEKSHKYYWKQFTEEVIKYLSFTNFCNWIFLSPETMEFKKCLANPFYINPYDKESIECIPNYLDKNYFGYTDLSKKEIDKDDILFYKMNRVLNKRLLTIIKW